ncbi:hypothetical protein [Okeania sp. SIO2B3]|uniref:hypothetical protein n=1 Tax=Okeania sp. SIO2B3 TaxID=2607784 RepID=UPI0013BF6653|nr:hypothetical protein [Okeania sp. SIO2B3]NET42664.1 hypothetical protein [Okeania sp. SIO2B3]
MTTETGIVYKTENRNDYGWEDRMLMPRESLTNILWENWTYQEKPTIPQIGDKTTFRCRDRTRNYKSESENGFTTHGRDGDWVVTRVEKFVSPDTDKKVFVCNCKYDPVEPKWSLINRGAKASELLEEKTEV